MSRPDLMEDVGAPWMDDFYDSVEATLDEGPPSEELEEAWLEPGPWRWGEESGGPQ